MSIDHATSLQALQLYGMATAWSELQAEKPRQAHRPESWMERLIGAEQTDRQLKSLRYQLKAARFPIHRNLLRIDWTETPLTRAVVEQLASAAFMETAHNLILVGGTGTGKAHLATAIGVAAIHKGKRMRFFNAVDLVNQLEREKSLGKVGNLAKQLCLVDAVILDELGYLPFPASGGSLPSLLITTLSCLHCTRVSISPRFCLKLSALISAHHSIIIGHNAQKPIVDQCVATQNTTSHIIGFATAAIRSDPRALFRRMAATPPLPDSSPAPANLPPASRRPLPALPAGHSGSR